MFHSWSLYMVYQIHCCMYLENLLANHLCNHWKKSIKKYVGVHSRKAVHLPTLEIRVGQKRNRVKKERKMEEKRKIINAAATGNRTRDLSITDQMDVLTNQVHLKIQFRHRFDQKCPFTDSLHTLGSRFARTSSVPLEITIWANLGLQKMSENPLIFPTVHCAKPEIPI